jgi:uncharacterized protein
MKIGPALATIVGCFCSLSPPAKAEETTQCDVLAANPHDPNRVAAGVPFFEIDFDAAIPACAASLARQPDSARLEYQYALALYRGRRTAEAVDFLRQAADKGYAPAESDLAYAIVTGDAGEKDYAEAVRLSRLAAAQGYAVAMGDLGWDYMHGLGVPIDYDQALVWLRRGVDLDDEYAMAHLGEMYEHGWSVKQDDTEAVKWYRRSADRGYRGGQYHLAMMLLRGRGVERDEAAAKDLLERAAAQNLPEAAAELRRLSPQP